MSTMGFIFYLGYSVFFMYLFKRSGKKDGIEIGIEIEQERARPLVQQHIQMRMELIAENKELRMKLAQCAFHLQELQSRVEDPTTDQVRGEHAS